MSTTMPNSTRRRPRLSMTSTFCGRVFSSVKSFSSTTQGFMCSPVNFDPNGVVLTLFRRYFLMGLLKFSIHTTVIFLRLMVSGSNLFLNTFHQRIPPSNCLILLLQLHLDVLFCIHFFLPCLLLLLVFRGFFFLFAIVVLLVLLLLSFTSPPMYPFIPLVITLLFFFWHFLFNH